MDAKNIYRHTEALVSDRLISAPDSEINATLPHSEAGMIIYTAGHTIEKQKALDGSWVAVAGGAGTPVAGKDGVTPKLQKTATAIQVSYDNGSSYEDLIQLSELKGDRGESGKDGAKGDKGDPGQNGAKGEPGANGVDGKSVIGIELKTDDAGRVTSGTVTFSDQSSAEITITTA